MNIQTSKHEEIIDITDRVQQEIPKDFSGVCTVFIYHSTAAIIINENWDKHLPSDILACLDKLIPQGKWKHDQIDNNGAAHIKAAIIGPSISIPVKNGTLQLGQWQGIGLAEFDGPRKRHISITTYA